MYIDISAKIEFQKYQYGKILILDLIFKTADNAPGIGSTILFLLAPCSNLNFAHELCYSV